MNRRGFFNRIVQTAAIVALAPKIAFGVINRSEQDWESWSQAQPVFNPERPKKIPFWYQTSPRHRFYDDEYLKVMEQIMGCPHPHICGPKCKDGMHCEEFNQDGNRIT